MAATRTISSSRYTNAALTVIAVMLTLLVGERFASKSVVGGTAEAAPADEATAGLVSAGEQRKQMIAELRSMNARIDKLTSSIKNPMPVKVTEMPPGFAMPRDQK